mgnify:CR=1 FL=1
MSSSTVILPLERTRYFPFRDGIATTKAVDDEIQLVLDWTDELASGETVSSAAYVDSGVTTSSKSVATPLTTCTVNKTGYTTVTVTLSTGRTRERRVYFISPHGGLGATDYR